ncbi:MAG: MmcQ/YjbR family DNA-binding protein [Planctomycetota bacterium]
MAARKANADPLLEKLRGICRRFPGSEEFTSFGHPGWRVGKKGFAYYEVYKGELCIVFKAELPRQQALVKSARFFVAPYIGKYGWTSLRCSTKLDWKEIADLVGKSHRLVAAATRKPRASRDARGRS